MTEQPLVSVVILSFEDPSLVLRRAIRSVLDQNLDQCQVVLVDANPPDSDYSLGLREDMERYPEIPVLSCPCKKGRFATAKNMGASATQGKYLAYLMGSDAWNQNCASAQVEELEKEPGLGMVFCQRWMVEEDAFSTEYCTEPEERQNREPGRMIQDEIQSVSQVMFRRSCFEELHGFDTRIDRQEDYDMWLRVGNKYKIASVDRNLVCSYLELGMVKKAFRLVDVVGYLQLYAKHEELYKKYPWGRLDLYRKIAACYKEARYYLPWARYRLKILWLEYRLGESAPKGKPPEGDAL